MRKTCLNEVYKLAQQDERVVFIGSDIGQGTLDNFKTEYPERFFMEGVSEAHLIGMMTGLAMCGKIPYMNTIATFITRRCYEQVLLDAGLHNQPIRIIGSGGGCVYAPLGPTHLAVEDIAIMRAIPNMTIFAPSDAEEMKKLMPATLDYDRPIYIRLAKGGDTVISRSSDSFEIGEPIYYKQGSDILFIGTGITSNIALEAAAILDEAGISAGVLHLHTLKPINQASLLKTMSQYKAIVTLEEHSIIGGLGAIISEIIAENISIQPMKLAKLALPDQFQEEYGSQNTTMDAAGISVANAVAQAKIIMSNG